MRGRDNGLWAAAYTPLADLDPRVADAMLDTLRAAGVAAYVSPAVRQFRGYTGVLLPSRPLDRLFVDAAARDLARTILRDHVPDLATQDRPGDAGDEDATWREIVASFNAPRHEPVPPWPADEDLDEFDGRRDRADEGIARAERPRAAPHPPLDDEDDHFVPPTPPPIPHPEPATALAWMSLFGGPAYLLVAATLGWPIPGWAAFLAIAAFVAGFVTLVVRMGDGPPRDSGSDDGAVV